MRYFRTQYSMRRCCIPLSIIILVLLSISSVAAQTDTQLIGTKAQHEQWIKCLTSLGTGQFNQAQELIRRIKAEGIQDQKVNQVYAWLNEFNRSQSERDERRQTDYEKYVNWIKEEIEAANKAGEKGKRLWKQAIGHCEWAFRNTGDQESFRKEPWLLETLEGATRAALTYEENGKWYDAASIYIRLTDIFPYNKKYRDAFETCQEHIRLELTYAPDSDWADETKNISADMTRDAFDKIKNEYLSEPVFKEAAISGLKQILLIINNPDLAEVFKGLNDEYSVEEFRIRVNTLLNKVNRQDEITVNELNEDYFETLLQINRETRLLPETVIIREFTNGALKPLDRYSDMIWPSGVEEFNKHTQGQFPGVGIQIRKAPDEPVKVISPLANTPAYQAGIQPGDLITKINGVSSKKYTINKAVREITGRPDTYVTLTIKRSGKDEEFQVRLKRQVIKIETIKGFERDEQDVWKFMIDPNRKIGYIRMTNFTERTIDELKSILQQLKQEQDLQGLIFDLRNNPGGTLKSAIDVSDLFLPSHKNIVSTKDRYGQPWVKSTSSSLHYTDFPMIVLVNGASASAAEIVAGALQVHRRARVIGERTFGKGSVQNLLLLNTSDVAFLKLTTQLYYLPNGRCLHKDEDSTTWGVDPDVEIKLVPKEINKVYELRLKKDIIKGKDQEELTEESLKYITEYRSSTQPEDEDKDESKESKEDTDEVEDEEEEHDLPPIDREGQDLNDWPEIDPQLDAAFLLMRVRLETDQAWPKQPIDMVALPVPNPPTTH
ncbi:MAG: S41 family peptidase [Planctomycetota bacterium]|nr:MAG: S41 family peptidase [Planctomycetota bacterium]